jgi:hypothetical protein
MIPPALREVGLQEREQILEDLEQEGEDVAHQRVSNHEGLAPPSEQMGEEETIKGFLRTDTSVACCAHTQGTALFETARLTLNAGTVREQSSAYERLGTGCPVSLGSSDFRIAWIVSMSCAPPVIDTPTNSHAEVGRRRRTAGAPGTAGTP